jgi:type IV secretion system protein VirD4
MMRRSPTPIAQPTEPLWVVIAAPAAALAVLVLVLLDAAAALSSFLSGRGLPSLRGGWIEGAALLLVHGGNPRAAWASPTAAPPRWLFLLSLAVLVGSALGVAFSLWMWWGQRRDSSAANPRLKQHGFLSPGQAASRFGARAVRRDARHLHPSLSGAELRRRPVAELAVPLGRCGSAPVFASHEHAVAVLAGMRQGKTTGVLARVALGHRGPLVYTTSKPADLELFVRPPEGSRGRVILFNPDDLAGLGTATFDPVIGCENPETARLRAEAILARQRARAQERGLDWALLAEKLLKYLLHAAALERVAGRAGGMGQVVAWSGARDFETPSRSLARSKQAASWTQLLLEMGRSAPETVYSIKINLHEALVCWEDPGLLERVTPGAGTEEIDPAEVVRGGHRLLVLARPMGHAVPLVTALVSAVVEAARQEARRALHGGGRLDPPLLLLLDEVTRVCPLPQMPELVTDCASQGIVPVFALQSLEDGEEAWGTSRFEGMWSATNCLVVMGMVSSQRTLRALSDLTPTVKVEVRREGRDHRGEALDPVARWEPALTADEIRAIPHHTGVAFYGPRPMRLRMPHVLSRGSEVRHAAEASRAAWRRWVATRTEDGRSPSSAAEGTLTSGLEEAAGA